MKSAEGSQSAKLDLTFSEADYRLAEGDITQTKAYKSFFKLLKLASNMDKEEINR
jgi:hypothetical protein